MPHFPSRSHALRGGLAALTTLALFQAVPALAGPPVWDGGWGRPSSGFDSPSSRLSSPRQKDIEGEVEVSRFVVEGDAAKALGHGPVKVVVLSNEGARPRPGSRAYDDMPPPDAPAEDRGSSYGPPQPSASPALGARGDDRENATFEAAVIDQLVKAGYETQPATGGEGQVVELRITHGVAQPPEAPRKPVSGEMEVGVSNRGNMMGLGINIDLTKPKKALLSTRLEVRIRDGENGAALWEGRADIATRDGSDKWTGQAIATELAEALFRKFPGKNGESFTQR